MSNKSKSKHFRPHAPPLPVLSQQQVEALLLGPPPTCCAAHVTAHAQHRAFIAGTPGPQVCLLCGALDGPMLRGFFAPFESQRYGAPPGKRRILAYSCCEPCWALPDREARVEDRALRDVRQAQARWN